MEVLTKLEEACVTINELFEKMEATNIRAVKIALVEDFRERHPDLNSDLDYCFEVLDGQHKIGYTYFIIPTKDSPEVYGNFTISKFVETVLKEARPTDEGIWEAGYYTPINAREFICRLVNRDFRLGYTNKHNMIKEYSPMLAKRYPDTVHEQDYYIQEKLDGNRCIAFYNNETEKWEFKSRSGKPLKVNFDMSWANKNDIFDGEIMTYGHAGSRDFNRTSGAINGKFTDKSALHYYIYDLIDTTRAYQDRYEVLKRYDGHTSDNCHILPVLDRITIYVNPAYNEDLDEWLDIITAKGGEGVMLRDPYAVYQCGKRSDALIKYKKVQTMDLRIIDWNLGNGKYANAIGSFFCETDDHKIQVNVSGMPDEIHFSDPADWMGRIIEVAYFDVSKSATKDTLSLRFPRLKRIRDDKDTTSIY